ncbi:unnamed protein product [Brassica oleracea]|uniref:(rape) hypothetical protein n=1 Tax=Brassica napus TaxID=3708 RepID=A0A816IWT1_BRANA|nr:unnamed protein product [Brassica napus]
MSDTDKKTPFNGYKGLLFVELKYLRKMMKAIKRLFDFDFQVQIAFKVLYIVLCFGDDSSRATESLLLKHSEFTTGTRKYESGFSKGIIRGRPWLWVVVLE